MKALTISQPFASLIASGEKWVENRMWPCRYRGPLAIHAGKGTQYLTAKELAAYPTGCVIAVATVVGCWTDCEIHNRALKDPAGIVPGMRINWEQLSEHQHVEGPYCICLAAVRKIDPVPCRGMQGLFEVDI